MGRIDELEDDEIRVKVPLLLEPGRGVTDIGVSLVAPVPDWLDPGDVDTLEDEPPVTELTSGTDVVPTDDRLAAWGDEVPCEAE